MKMYIFLFCSIFAVSSAFVIQDGPCPDIKPLENFKFDEFAGKWNDYANIPPSAAGEGKCGQVEYTRDGDKLKVWNGNVVNGVQRYIDGPAIFTVNETVAEFEISFEFKGVVRDNVLSVIDTDYKKYSIFYSCENENGSHKGNIWVALRDKTLGEDLKKKIGDFLTSKGFDPSKLVDGDFSDEACKFTSSSRIEEYPYKK